MNATHLGDAKNEQTRTFGQFTLAISNSHKTFEKDYLITDYCLLICSPISNNFIMVL
ncbi:hypothetical protein C7972_101500 [Arenibacter sp. ARW7G5Y1]|nr:hypothetical protein C7972_101500 [Arenibacter sp. ARW7G5Y1]